MLQMMESLVNKLESDITLEEVENAIKTMKLV